MKQHLGAALIGALLSTGVAATETVVSIYQDGSVYADATIGNCGNGCVQQMAVTAKHQFVFDGNYNSLYNELLELGLRVTVYEDGWEDAESGELVMKVSSTVHQRQRWRRTNLRRKVETPAEMANAIYATAAPGQVVTLEFLQQAKALSGNDFTINLRRYTGETIVGSSSRAVTPSTFNDDGHSTIEY